MKMNVNDIRNAAKRMTIAELTEVFQRVDAVEWQDGSFAILQNVVTDDGVMEVWTDVTIKSKVWKDTKNARAFDPFERAQEWEAEKEFKAQEKEAKKKEKS